MLHWDRYQRRYREAVDGEEVVGEPAWMRAIICKVWGHAYAHWKARNILVHGEGGKGSQAMREALINMIRALYAHEENLLVQIRVDFSTPMESWKYKSIITKRMWIRVHQLYIRECFEDDTRASEDEFK